MMIRNKTLSAAALAALLALSPLAGRAQEGDATQGDAAAAPEEHANAAHAEAHVTDYAFSFEGPFGTYDQLQLQRGLQIFTEVCSACHGMRYVPIRTLGAEDGPGLPEDQVRAYAEQFVEVYDTELEDYRPAKPSDLFPANTSQGAPDLSLMAKGRAGFHGPYGTGLSQLFNGMGGPEYIVSLLNGYTGNEKVEAGVTLYENTAFAGGWIRMAPPLYGEDVDFEDGAPNDMLSESKDIASFLMWAAEPKMMARKHAGFVAVIFLILLTSLLYLTNKSIWAPIKKGKATPAE